MPKYRDRFAQLMLKGKLAPFMMGLVFNIKVAAEAMKPP